MWLHVSSMQCIPVLVRMQARNTALIINPHPQGALELRWMAPVFLIKLSTSSPYSDTPDFYWCVHWCAYRFVSCVCVIVRLNVREGSQGVKPHLQRRPIRQPYHCLHLFHQTSKAQTTWGFQLLEPSFRLVPGIGGMWDVEGAFPDIPRPWSPCKIMT